MHRLVTTALTLLTGLVLAAAPQLAQAERRVNANAPIVISDDVRDRAIDVQSASDGSTTEDFLDVAPGDAPAPVDKNRSGLGDETNPGTGGGTDKAKNDGTDNPNKSGH
jgi:hypothetical protein